MSLWGIGSTYNCQIISGVLLMGETGRRICIKQQCHSSTAGWREVFGGLDNLELFEYTQHSDSIISWRSIGLCWDAFQMCLNNRGIELPLKRALEIKGSNLLSHHFLQTIISFSPGQSLLFCHSFFSPLFILSFHCFHRCIFGPEASVFPTLSPVTLVDHKNAGQRRVWGGSGIPHAEGKHSNCQADTHTHRSKHGTYLAVLTSSTTPTLCYCPFNSLLTGHKLQIVQWRRTTER